MRVNLRFISFINGVILCGLAISMSIPVCFDILFCNGQCFGVFIPSVLFCLFIGISTILACRDTSEQLKLTQNDSYLLVVSIWVIASVFSAFPFYFYHGTESTFIQALFESTSGLTTTGVTIYSDVESLPLPIHLWRFILHFMGGIGVVAIGIIALPMMRVGGMQLFTIENSDKSNKIFPRTSHVAWTFACIYFITTILFALILRTSGMAPFDALCHSISAISTGGFSTKNAGIAGFSYSGISFILAIEMLLGGLSFTEIIRCFKYGPRSFLKNQQTSCYIKIILISITCPIAIGFFTSHASLSIEAIAKHVFNTISSISTTGFNNHGQYINSNILFFLLALIGGCSGSTTGGIKVFRLQVLYSILKNQITQQHNTTQRMSMKYQGRIIDESLIMSVITYFVLLSALFLLSVVLLHVFTEMNISNICHIVLSHMFNIGYIPEVSSIKWVAKIVLITDMIAGRLEIMPIVMLIGYLRFRR
jgi:trk system potassium uptake protein TrkH